jgi:hypothetical protein
MVTTEFSKAYATPEQYRGLLELRSGQRDEDIQADLEAGARFLDNALNRRMGFNNTGTAVARIYVPQADDDVLDVDDIAVAAGVEVKIDTSRDGTFGLTLAAGDFELHPLGEDTRPEPRPFKSIWRLNTRWARGYRVSVKAIYGWQAIPKPIERANIRIASLIRGQGNWSTTTVNADLNTVLRASPAAQNIIGELTRDYWRPSI